MWLGMHLTEARRTANLVAYPAVARVNPGADGLFVLGHLLLQGFSAPPAVRIRGVKGPYLAVDGSEK
jgi:hypothetical protein